MRALHLILAVVSALALLVGMYSIGPAQPASAAEFATDYWTSGPDMPTARSWEATVTSADGTIYAVGGQQSASTTATVDAYSPTTGIWTTLSAMPTARSYFAATLGPDGRIYVIGGSNGESVFRTVEAYDPSLNQWFCSANDVDSVGNPIPGCATANLTPMPTARQDLAAATAACPSPATGPCIYAIGGWNNGPLQTVEAYDPSADTWTCSANAPGCSLSQVVGAMPTPRADLAATVRANGNIVAIGGFDSADNPLGAVEEYSPSDQAWYVTDPSLPTPRARLAVATGLDGTIYAIGGYYTNTEDTTTAVEAFNPAVGSWSEVPPLHTPRAGLGAAAGLDGAIYAIGGYDGANTLGTVEVHYPKAGAWSTAPPMPTARSYLAAALGTDGTVYALGGFTTTAVGTVEAYRSDTRLWTAVPPMSTPRYALAATTGHDGAIYAIGGNNGSTLGTVESYTPGGGWTTKASLPTPRDSLAATTGLDGTIYAIGGEGSAGTLATVEAYNPSTGKWTARASMPTARFSLTAVTGLDGTIYAIGGYVPCGRYMCGPIPQSAVEAYTPATNTWRTLAPMPTARSELAAAVGPSGDIYAIGGRSASGVPGGVEVYHPGSDTWSSRPSMPTARGGLAALADGAGGIYTIGGYDSSETARATVELYHPTVTHWTCSEAHGCTPGAQVLTEPTGIGVSPGLAAGLDGSLYAMGGTGANVVAAVEVRNPVSGDWTSAMPLPNPRTELSATTGADGTIYAVGGEDSGLTPVNSLYAYTPSSNSWSTRALMPTPRRDLAAVTGQNGLIYAIGGETGDNAPVSVVQAYDPATNQWTTKAPMHVARSHLAAAVGLDGTIYAFGGQNNGGILNTVEAYDPTSNSWSYVASMPTARSYLGAASGPDGRIYTFGGRTLTELFDTVEVYRPETNAWSIADPLPDLAGNVAAVTGRDGTIYATSDGSWYAYSLRANTWSTMASLPTGREQHAMVTTADGSLYALGGCADASCGSFATSLDTYHPAGDYWSSRAPLPTGRAGLAAVVGANGLIYALGGTAITGYSSLVEAYNPSTNTWTCSTGDPAPSGCASKLIVPMPTPRPGLAAVTALCPGSTTSSCVYAMGGYSTTCSGGFCDVVEVYDPSTNTWTCSTTDPAPSGPASCAAKTLQPLPSPSYGLGATVSAGVIYAFGGTGTNPGGAGGSLATSYLPATNTWTTLAALPTPRGDVATTPGPDGRLYVFGGTDANYLEDVVEAYNPSDNTWTCSQGDPNAAACTWSGLAPLPTARSRPAATTGLDGTIYVSGGLYGTIIRDVLETYIVPNTLASAPSVPIAQGWNLIDMPVRSMSLASAGALGASVAVGTGPGSITAVAAYANGRFNLFVPGYSADVPLQFSQGIFVLSTRSGTWRPPASAYTSGQRVSLQPGWNLVGAPYPSAGLGNSAFQAQIGSGAPAGGCGFQEVATYSNGYQVHLPGDTYHVAATQGMWILCTKSYVWTPS